jgi:hypothetical protein
MSQTQILFSEHKIIKQSLAPAKCFEIAEDNNALKPLQPEDTGGERKRFFTDANLRKNTLVPTFEQALRPAPLFPAMRENRQELSYALLFYLDQIVYLEEISENLEKLDAAIELENTTQVSLIANDCAGMSARCGMFAALKPLRELERVELKNQIPKAQSLCREVGREFEIFKITLKETLEQISR